MIDEQRTFEIYGYKSTDLAPQSNKRIVAICDNCGKVRDLKKQNYNSLCHGCAVTDPEFREKRSMAIKKRFEDPVVRKKMSESAKKRWSNQEAIEERRQMSLEQWRKPGARESISGPNHSQWKGGVSADQDRFHKSVEYREWRRLVFKRDDFTCKMCNVRGGTLNAHHILPYRDWKEPEYSLNIENGITLCKTCHDKTINKEYENFSLCFDALHNIGEFTP